MNCLYVTTFNKFLYELKHFVKKTIKKIPKKSYLNYLKYAYEQKQQLQSSKKTSTRKRPLKKYKQ